MALILLLFICNHDNLIIKLHQKNCYLNEGWLSVATFKVGSASEMITKEVLPPSIYKPA